MRPYIDEIGNVYGKLMVIKLVDDPRQGAHWLCECECGNTRVVVGGSLRKGHPRSCGCTIGGYSAEERTARALFGSYKGSAKARGYKWNISMKFFLLTTKQNCFYCGSLPSNIHQRKDCNGKYMYNGMDRIDNDKGYIEDNIVPCCKICNLAKGTSTPLEFGEWINRLVQFRSKTNGR